MKAPLAPEKALQGFIAKFSPDMARLIRAARTKMRQRISQAIEMVYDNYNSFVIGYGPNEKAGDAIFSLAAQAKGLSLCFLQGALLPDPLPANGAHRLIIKSVSKKQRPRRTMPAKGKNKP